MKKFLLLQILFLACLILPFTKTAPCQENQTIIKQFSLPEENWSLIVSAVEHKLHFTIDKKEYVQDGIVIRLHRKKKGFENAVGNEQILMWEKFFPDAGPQRWVADMHLDATTKKSYLAFSNGNSFWAKIIDWDGVVKRVPSSMGEVKLSKLIKIEKQDPGELLQPVSSGHSRFRIDDIKIEYVAQEIVVHLTSAEKQKTKWIFSLETGTWSETDQTVKSDEFVGTQFTKTGNSYFSEAELSAPQHFVPSEERGYWEYSKSRPGVRIEGDGIYVNRRPLPAAATQAEDDAESQRQGKAPAYEYEFSVHHVTPNVEMFSRVMWKLRVENPTRTPIDFAVYDTTFDRAADVMAVIFRLNGIVRANFLRGPGDGLPWADTKLNLTVEEASRLTKARIEGSPGVNSLRLIVSTRNSPDKVFALRETKWIQLP